MFIDRRDEEIVEIPVSKEDWTEAAHRRGVVITR